MPHTELEFYFIFGLLLTLLSPIDCTQPRFSPQCWVSAPASPSLLYPPFLRGGSRQTFSKKLLPEGLC